MTSFEIGLAVAGAVIALLLFALEVHGRKMEHRSPRERVLIAGVALTLTVVFTLAILRARRSARDQSGPNEQSTPYRQQTSETTATVPPLPSDQAQPSQTTTMPPAASLPHTTTTDSTTSRAAPELATAGNTDTAPPAIADLKEEPAEPGTVRGYVTVCKYGVVPSKQQYSGIDAYPAEICVRRDDGRIVKVKYQRYQFGPSSPPVYFRGDSLSIYQLVPGDYIECRIMLAANDPEDGVMHSPSNVLAGTPTLRDIQLLRRPQ